MLVLLLVLVACAVDLDRLGGLVVGGLSWLSLRADRMAS